MSKEKIAKLYSEKIESVSDKFLNKDQKLTMKRVFERIDNEYEAENI